MKPLKTFFIGCLAAAALCSAADKKPSPILSEDGKLRLDTCTTTDHLALVLYQKGEDGFLNKVTMVAPVESITLSQDEIIAFDTKNKKIIYSTDRGVYTATIKKELAGTVEKINGLKKLKKDKDFEALIKELSQDLDTKANEFNAKHLSDVKQQMAVQDQIRKDEQYRLDVKEFRLKRLNSWRTWKMVQNDYTCDVCKESHAGENQSLYLVKTTPTHWFYKIKKTDDPEWSSTIHSMKPRVRTENNKLYFDAFEDSLKEIAAKKNELPCWTPDAVRKKNLLFTDEAFRKSMPYGFIYNWGWDTYKGNVILEVTYLNASDKTIEKLRFFTDISGPDNKKLKSCSFLTNSPIAPGEYGHFRFENTKEKVDDSASNMAFTKIIITYTDGSSVTLSGKELKVFRQ